MTKHPNFAKIPENDLHYPLPIYVTFSPEATPDSIERYWKTFNAQQKFCLKMATMIVQQ